MKDLSKDVEANIRELEAIKAQIQKGLKNVPSGGLRVSKRPGGNSRYYHKYMCDGVQYDKPISIKNQDLIRGLAEKSYLNHLKNVVDDELACLYKLSKQYQPEEKYNVYSKLSDERKQLVTPLLDTPELAAKRWAQEDWKGNTAYLEGLIHETDRGEMVRSKSEKEIANQLYQFRDILDYRYEQELFLPKTRVLIHPDFTILNKLNGKITYWEHNGMMDDETYMERFTRKMNTYTLEGIYPGNQLIMTFETKQNPLSTRIIRTMITELIEME